MRNVFTTLGAPLTFIDPEMPLSLDNRRDNNKEDGQMDVGAGRRSEDEDATYT